MRLVILVFQAAGLMLIGIAAVGSSAKGAGRLYPTAADEPTKVSPGNMALGSGTIEGFGWSVAVQRGANKPCFRASVVGPCISSREVRKEEAKRPAIASADWTHPLEAAS
jgi:hypothetical protein